MKMHPRTMISTSLLSLLGAALAVGLPTMALAGSKTHQHAPATAQASAAGIIGMHVDDFQLVDHEGVAHDLYYYKDAPAIVIMTQGNGCPIVRNAMPALRKVRDQYADQGVKFFLLNSNLQDNTASIAAEAEEFGFDMPVLVDEHQLIGESLKVTRTAEVFLIDNRTRKVVYHGPIDDRLTYQVQKGEAKDVYLADALDAVLGGQQVARAEVDAPGCLVNFPERDRAAEHANISYSETIAPLLEKRCVDCHTEGGIGPWAMSSYEMVKGFSPMIREVLRTDRMPPWNSDPNIGHFLRDRSLTGDEVKTLVHWIEAGSPRGDGPDPLAVPREPPADWPLGEPDLVIKVPAYDVPASGVVDYQRPVVANPLTEPKWLRASTIKVGSREAVHHVLTGMMKEMPASGRSNESEWGASVGGYAVGAESQIARDNMGTYLPVGGAIGLQMHYTPFGKAVRDETEIGLYFYDEPPELIERQSVIADVSIEIPPGADRHEEIAYIQFPRDAELLAAFPHAHYRGQSSKLTLQTPDGKERVILSLPRYDFNWQRLYEFEEPIDVPAGSRLIAHYTYDNSPLNPANPDPEGRIFWGDQSFEEMLFTAFNYRWKEETSSNVRDDYERELEAGRGFGMLDDNLDGKLVRSELRGRTGQRIAANFDRTDVDGDGALSTDEYYAMLRAMREERQTASVN